MSLSIIRVEQRAELRSFIRLPSLLPARRPNYVPPFWADEEEFHSPAKNASLRACHYERWLAIENGAVVGRVMGIIHPAYNALRGESCGRFYQLASIDRQDVVAALLSQAETWARGRGMDRIIGPFGLSDKDPQGMQVDGFEYLPVLATPTDPAYMAPLVEACGYGKHADALVYQVEIPSELPEVYQRLVQRVMGKGDLRLLHLRTKQDLRPWIVPVLRLVNETYGELLGFMPMSEQEMQELAAKYMPVLDPSLVKLIVDATDRPVAFVVAMPDMSIGLQRAKGRLFPLGWWHILRAMRSTRQLDLFLGAVRPDQQGRGLTTVLATSLFQEARARGLTLLDSHLVLESNMRMRAELERLGARVRKRYRVYEKAL